MDSRKMAAGEQFPALSWPTVGGKTLSPAAEPGWRMLIVYRGKHCPLCKKQLDALEQLRDEFSAAGVAVSALSADTREKAESQVAETGWQFPVGYGLTPQQARQLGLYVSNPRSATETDRPFAEPGVFVLNPQGQAQIIDISNAPFARPDLKSLLKGLQFIMEKDYPIRGTA